VSSIDVVVGRQVLDSRGNPTVEVVVLLESGAAGRAMVPSGASTGRFEAVELRDGGDFWGGKGVSLLSPTSTVSWPRRYVALRPATRRTVDRALLDADGTDDKGRLGANAILGVSLAVAHAAADEAGVALYRYVGGTNSHVLPVPMLNVINGGEHADNNVDIQEFMFMPVGAASFSEALRWGVECYHTLRGVLSSRGLATAVGDEGGFAPNLGSNEEAVQLLVEAIGAAGFNPGSDVALALDVASTEFFADGSYELAGEGRSLSSGAMVDYLAGLSGRYPIVSIEDAWPKTTGTAGSPLLRRSATASSWLATTCSSQTPSGSSGESTAGVANSILVRSTRSEPSPRPSRPSSWRLPTATRPWCPTDPVRPRTPPSPTWRWPPTVGRSDRGAGP
jgi:enolase